MTQLNLDYDFKRARSSDPITSFIAADKAKYLTKKNYPAIIKALNEIGSGTYKQISDASGVDATEVGRRITELGALGIAEPIHSEGVLLKVDGCRVWRLKNGQS